MPLHQGPGNSDSLPDTHNPLFAEAEARTAARAEESGASWHDPREDGIVPDAYIAMGQTAENLARSRASAARRWTSSAYGRRTSPRRP
ncbi:acetyl-CoA C-acetyltransferase [Streptomyces tanashiensis]